MNASALELLRHAGQCGIPDALHARTDAIAAEADWYQQAIRDARRPIYGANTLTGHLDSVRVPYPEAAALQQAIIDSHCIGSAPYFDPVAARLIGYAKACAFAAGGSGISRELYLHLLDSLADASFQPQIPMDASYSCGDVIPGAHWARALIGHGDFSVRHSLQPGEALALINGAFVDIGCTLALVAPLHRGVAHCALNAKLIAAHRNRGVARPRSGPPVADDVLAFISEGAAEGDPSPTQAAVSIRATPQIMVAVLTACSNLVAALDDELSTPSANPYVDVQQQQVLSQASFMSPRLAIAKSAACEAVLFAMWACQGRITAIKSELESRQQPGQDMLDLVQWPKFTQALLEGCRMRLGRRLFASGSGTSQGIEDLWSFGVLASAQLDDAISTWRRMEGVLYRLLLMVDPDTGDDADITGTLPRQPDVPVALAPAHLAWRDRFENMVATAPG